jgi:hypothetical protein
MAFSTHKTHIGEVNSLLTTLIEFSLLLACKEAYSRSPLQPTKRSQYRMEMSLYSYHKQTKMSSVFYKNREQEVKISPVWGIGTSGRGRI